MYSLEQIYFVNHVNDTNPFLMQSEIKCKNKLFYPVHYGFI